MSKNIHSHVIKYICKACSFYSLKIAEFEFGDSGQNKRLKIWPGNSFFFAVSKHKSASRKVSPILRRDAKMLKLNIKTRLIRRLIETSLQSGDFNLTVEKLARHWGHSKELHMQFYRTHLAAIELGKISRVLCSPETNFAKGSRKMRGEK